MKIEEFFYVIVVFIVIMFVYKYADKMIKTLPNKTVRIVNWVGFVISLVGGTLWYLTNSANYMFLSLFGIVIYFLFYSYDKPEKGDENADSGTGDGDPTKPPSTKPSGD